MSLAVLTIKLATYTCRCLAKSYKGKRMESWAEPEAGTNTFVVDVPHLNASRIQAVTYGNDCISLSDGNSFFPRTETTSWRSFSCTFGYLASSCSMKVIA